MHSQTNDSMFYIFIFFTNMRKYIIITLINIYNWIIQFFKQYLKRYLTNSNIFTRALVDLEMLYKFLTKRYDIKNLNMFNTLFIFFNNLKFKCQSFHSNNSLYFIVLFITSSFILSVYATDKNLFLSIYYLLCFFCLFVYLSYVPLYYWRNLEVSFFSFISYFIALGQIFSLFLIYNIIYPSTPIYIYNLSYFTAFRYLIIASIAIVFFIMFLKKKTIPLIPINPLAEIQKIAYTWNSYSILGKFSLFILKKLVFSKKFRYFYIIFDIFLNIIPKIYILWIIINFIFFSGDLRDLFLLAPYIIIIICCSHIQYYIEYIIEGNSNVIRELVTVVSLPNSNNALLFSLTQEAKNMGFTVEKDLPGLSVKWIELSNLSLFFQYKKKLKLFSFLFSIIQILCWIAISIYFLYFLDMDATLASFPWQKIISIVKSPWTMSKQYFSSNSILLAPRDSGYLYEKYQNQLKLLTNGEFNIGHPIVGELLPNGVYRVDGYLTHGIPPSSNILYNIIPYSIDPNAKNMNSQNFVAFHTPVFINPSWIGNKIKGSQSLLEDLSVKLILESFLKTIQKDK